MHQSKEAKFQGKSIKVVMKCLQELVSQSSTELVGGQCLLIYSGHWTLDTVHTWTKGPIIQLLAKLYVPFALDT